MKAKKLMRWTLALALTGVCAALAVVTLDAWTGTGATAHLSAPPPVVTSAVPIVPPATDSSLADSPVVGAITETALTVVGLPPEGPQAVPAGSPGAARPTGDDGVMLAAAPPVPAGEGRLLEQIETARVGLFAAQVTVPARPAARSAWLPVIFLAGGGGLIGCALGLGLGSLILRRRAVRRTVGTTATAAAPSRESRTKEVAPDDSAAAVLQAARAELAARAAWDRGSPAVSAGPGAEARIQALSRLAAAGEFAATGEFATAPSIVSSPVPALPATTSSTGHETVPIRPHRTSFFGIAPRRRSTVDYAHAASLHAAGPPPGASTAARARAIDATDDFPMRRQEADPVDRRIAAIERSLLQVVRAMEEVAERVADRETSSVRLRAGTRASGQGAGQDGGQDSSGLEQTDPVAPRLPSEDDEDSKHDAFAPPMRAPRRHEREARPRVAASSSPIAALRSVAPVASGPVAAPARPAASVVRAVRALRAARDQTPAAPEPWDLSPAAPPPRDPAVTVRQEPAPSIPSASTADGRDLVRIRRAVLRLAAEGWDGGRIAEQLRLGEGDVALIVKTAGVERRLQPTGRGR
jgi:hypothetical protein